MPDQPRMAFNALVLSLAATAAVHFGDVPEPGSAEPPDPNLEGAAQMIALLELLKDKTRGNLATEEAQFLEQTLYELRMRFLEASGIRPKPANPA